MKKIIVLSIFSIAMFFLSCNEDFLQEEPKSFIGADNLYTDLSGFEAGIVGLYKKVRDEIGYDSYYSCLYWWATTDLMFPGNPSSVSNPYVYYGAYNNPSASFVEQRWTVHYETINACNTIIERAENEDVDWGGDSEEENLANKNKIIAEARFVRARTYRYLTYLFGDAPLVLTESKSVVTNWQRDSKSDIIEQMIADWEFAAEYLPDPDDLSEPGRLSKYAAYHSLAEEYLRIGELDKAKEAADAVINSGKYYLMTERFGVNASEDGTPFSDLFFDGNVQRRQGNMETVFCYLEEYAQKNNGGYSWVHLRRAILPSYYNIPGIELSVEYGGRGIGWLMCTKNWLDMYGDNDDRGGEFGVRRIYNYNTTTGLPEGASIGDPFYPQTHADSIYTWFSPRKIEWATETTLTVSSQCDDRALIRLAETYILRAEIKMRMNDKQGAADDINAVRERAHATPITAADVNIDFILDEYARELIAETPYRHHLLRTGKLLERTLPVIENDIAGAMYDRSKIQLSARDTLFPIPQVVIDANLDADFPQNPGYN